ncbi:MAG: hypothetical protein KW806_02115 [Candidatus Yanofskybacteria bacterium]|nr:hypothetical protein [Candidatus Yanofskybacteria bacterium]
MHKTGESRFYVALIKKVWHNIGKEIGMCLAQGPHQGEYDSFLRRMTRHLATMPGDLFRFDASVPAEIVSAVVQAIETENGPVVEETHIDGDSSFIRFRIGSAN